MSIPCPPSSLTVKGILTGLTQAHANHHVGGISAECAHVILACMLLAQAELTRFLKSTSERYILIPYKLFLCFLCKKIDLGYFHYPATIEYFQFRLLRAGLLK
jgi:hypothetical protein